METFHSWNSQAGHTAASPLMRAEHHKALQQELIPQRVQPPLRPRHVLLLRRICDQPFALQRRGRAPRRSLRLGLFCRGMRHRGRGCGGQGAPYRRRPWHRGGNAAGASGACGGAGAAGGGAHR